MSQSLLKGVLASTLHRRHAVRSTRYHSKSSINNSFRVFGPFRTLLGDSFAHSSSSLQSSLSLSTMATATAVGSVADEVLQRLRKLEKLMGPSTDPRVKRKRGDSSTAGGIAIANDATIDLVLKQLKALHELGVVIPYTYLFDAISILVERNDILRTEIILSLALHNYDASKGSDGSSSSSKSKSGWRMDAFSKLGTFALDKLIAKNSFSSESLAFWVRLSSLGYTTSRATIFRILDTMATPGAHAPLPFIDKITSIVQDNLWHQSAGYHRTAFDIYRNYIFSNCSDKLSISVANRRIDLVWRDYLKLTKSMDTVISSDDSCKISHNKLIEIHCHRIRCLLALADKAKVCDKDSFESYRTHALDAFNLMLGIGDGKAVNNDTLAASATAAIQSTKSDIKARILSAGQLSPNTSSCGNIPVIRLPLFGFASPVAVTEGNKIRSNRYSSHGRNHHLMLVSLLSSAMEASDSADFALLKLQAYVSSCGEQINIFGSGLCAEQPSLRVEDPESLKIQSALKSKLSKKIADDSLALPGALSENGRTWLSNVLKALVSNMTMSPEKFNSVLSDASLAQTTKSAHEKHSNKINSIIEFAKSYQIVVPVDFFCRAIESFGVRRTGTSLRTTHRVGSAAKDSVVFDSALELSNAIIGQFSTQTKLSSPADLLKLKQSIVSMLSSYHCESALDKAMSTMYTCIDDSHTDNGSKAAIIDKMFLDVSSSAVVCYSDDKLRNLSVMINTHNQDRGINIALMIKDLIIHSRLRNGADAYKRLQSISQAQIKSLKNKSDGGGCSIATTIDVSAYQSVISALYRQVPNDEYSWSLAKNPLMVSEWIVNDQMRCGYRPTKKQVSLLLPLFIKNCQIGKHQGYADKAARDMISFLEQYTTFNGEPAGDSNNVSPHKVAVDEEMLSLLVKGLCIAGKEEDVLALLSKLSQNNDSDVKVTAKVYEPVVYNYAVVMGRLSVANDIVTTMLNRNLPLSTRIVDAIVAGTVQSDGAADALDDLQTLFTQHGPSARPSAGSLLNLIDYSLARGDVSEAQRVVSVIDQMFTEEERALSMSSDVDKVSLGDMSLRAVRRHAVMPSRYGIQYDDTAPAAATQDEKTDGVEASTSVNPLARRVGVLTREALAGRIASDVGSR